MKHNEHRQHTTHGIRDSRRQVGVPNAPQRQAIQKTIDRLEVSMPELPEAEAETDDDGWLFESDREDFEQLAVYKVRKNGAQK